MQCIFIKRYDIFTTMEKLLRITHTLCTWQYSPWGFSVVSRRIQYFFFKKEHYLCFLYKENPFPTASGQIQDYLNRSQRHVYLESMK